MALQKREYIEQLEGDGKKLRIAKEYLSDGSEVFNVEVGMDQAGNPACVFYCFDEEDAYMIFDFLRYRDFDTIGQHNPHWLRN